MKIEKGYTLSQFVDKVAETTDALNLLGGYSDEYQAIINYNEFVKQPLTRGMFVNRVEKPSQTVYIENPVKYKFELSAWQEAEKKVIFKGVVYHNIQPSQSSNYWTVNGETIAVESNGGHFCLLYRYKTIADIFQATNGELITQNINI